MSDIASAYGCSRLRGHQLWVGRALCRVSATGDEEQRLRMLSLLPSVCPPPSDQLGGCNADGLLLPARALLELLDATLCHLLCLSRGAAADDSDGAREETEGAAAARVAREKAKPLVLVEGIGEDVKALIAKRYSPSGSNARDVRQAPLASAAFYLAAFGSEDALEMLLACPSVDARHTRDKHCRSLLTAAASKGRWDAVERLLSCGCGIDVAHTDPIGRTALWMAVASEQLELVERLLEYPGGEQLKALGDRPAR